MFGRCSKLIGGNGTTYNSSHKNKEYARIDTEETPGYFTSKEDITTAEEQDIDMDLSTNDQEEIKLNDVEETKPNDVEENDPNNKNDKAINVSAENESAKLTGNKTSSVIEIDIIPITQNNSTEPKIEDKKEIEKGNIDLKNDTTNTEIEDDMN